MDLRARGNGTPLFTMGCRYITFQIVYIYLTVVIYVFHTFISTLWLHSSVWVCVFVSQSLKWWRYSVTVNIFSWRRQMTLLPFGGSAAVITMFLTRPVARLFGGGVRMPLPLSLPPFLSPFLPLPFLPFLPFPCPSSPSLPSPSLITARRSGGAL